MKKITLLLIFVPVFLITAINFTGGNTEEHPPYLKGFTCSSCHATIIDGIIINGKTNEDLSAVKVSIELPNTISFSAVQVDIKDVKDPKNSNFPVYAANDFGTIYNVNNDQDTDGKKANILTFEIPIEKFNNGEELEVQGLLTNADGTGKGDFSFSEKIILEKKAPLETSPSLQIFPTVASSQITIKGAKENTLVSIISINGQLVDQKIITNSKEIIDVSNFENGYYFVQTNIAETQTITQFIVAK